jgi:serine/threonine protein kinase
MEYVSSSSDSGAVSLTDGFLIPNRKKTLIRYFGKGDQVCINSSINVISEGCFSGCQSVIEVVFASDSQLKEIGPKAFENSGLKSIQFPRTLEGIGESCFSECKSIHELRFLSSPSIAWNAFKGCPLKCVKVAKGVVLTYPFPSGCVIEGLEKKREIADWVIDLAKDYEPVELIGETGEVELWKHRESGEEIAVKSYPRSPEAEEKIQDEFLQEVSALIILDHPCIVKIKGCCLPQPREGPKLISEYLANGSLKPILESGANCPRWWTVARRTNCIVGIVLGMTYIHSKGLIHRDLKPENILLDDNHRVRICDFGSSREFEAGVTMTKTGTLLYMAPEVDEGHYDEKVDVYSFGIILYEIVSCDERFSSGGNKTNLFVQLRNGWRPDIVSGVTELSKSLIERCWSSNACDRPSFDEILIELYENEFELIPGTVRAEVDSYLLWLERNGGK